MILACVTVLCYLTLEYMALYTTKTSWYSMNDVLGPMVSERAMQVL